MQLPFVVRRVVSGGQTGVDRGALDAAIELGIEHGGWCPRGRRAEDGVIPARYSLHETARSDYRQRTEQNVIDSDATLILTVGEPTGGTALTIEFCRKHGRPHLVVDLDQPPHRAIEATRAWLVANAIATLNVAGPRESRAPGLQRRVGVVLMRALRSAR